SRSSRRWPRSARCSSSSPCCWPRLGTRPSTVPRATRLREPGVAIVGDRVKLASYWQESAPPFQGGAQAAALDARADAVVIGAGFTGLSAALALARRGAKVVV